MAEMKLFTRASDMHSCVPISNSVQRNVILILWWRMETLQSLQWGAVYDWEMKITDMSDESLEEIVTENRFIRKSFCYHVHFHEELLDHDNFN